MSRAGHCVDINGDYWHLPGECPGAVDNCDGKCCEKRAPVQGSTLEGRLYHRQPAPISPGTISWEEHERAWQAYAKCGHGSQSAERLAERGGFSYFELIDLLGRPPATWRPR